VKVLATYNIKGGVGKTAAAVNLAHVAADEGNRVLVWDLDPQGAATFYFRVKAKVKGGAEALITGERDLDRAIKGTDYDNLDLLPADFSYRHLDLVLDGTKKPTRRLGRLLRPLRKHYDHVLLVPVIPTTLSIRTFDQLSTFIADADWRRTPELLAFFSMVDGRKTLHKQLVGDITRASAAVLDTRIAASTEVERMGERRAPVTAYAPRSRSARAYRELWREVSKRL
jgi:chromosome partitioning protein